MVSQEHLKSLLQKNNGTITTSQANFAGISNERLRSLEAEGRLERVARGVYIAPEAFEDKMYISQLVRPSMIYSHETALYVHRLTDRDPISYTVTVPSGYNAQKLRKDDLKVFFVKREFFELGADEGTTIFGNKIRVYGLERTICDCIRSRNQMDSDAVAVAIKRYASRQDKDLNILMKMAEAFHIDKLLRGYLEVLL